MGKKVKVVSKEEYEQYQEERRKRIKSLVHELVRVLLRQTREEQGSVKSSGELPRL